LNNKTLVGKKEVICHNAALVLNSPVTRLMRFSVLHVHSNAYMVLALLFAIRAVAAWLLPGDLRVKLSYAQQWRRGHGGFERKYVQFFNISYVCQ
jgi:hypothetical protein